MPNQLSIEQIAAASEKSFVLTNPDKVEKSTSNPSVLAFERIEFTEVRRWAAELLASISSPS